MPSDYWDEHRTHERKRAANRRWEQCDRCGRWQVDPAIHKCGYCGCYTREAEEAQE